MKLEFTKMHGLGNDFVFVDGFSQEASLSAAQVASLCDRHRGIGADGVIVVRPSERPECAGYMHYVNADGTLAQMCGNGVRCFAKYLVDRGFVQAGDGCLVADTLAGPKPIRFEVGEDGLMTSATVNMGRPTLDPHAVPVDAPANAVGPDGRAYLREQPIESPWGTFSFTCVSMGNPHAVCFVDDWATVANSLFDDPSDKRLATFDINRIGAWVTGERSMQKALLFALLLPNETLKELQDTANFGKLMYLNEELKLLPLGDIWNEYLARQGMNNEWYAEVEKYEKEVLSLRK